MSLPPKTPREEAREVGLALKTLRERQGVTQEAAAEAAGVTRTAWQNYENGRPVVLRTDMQAKLARAVGSTRDELLRIIRETGRGEAPHSSTGFNEGGAIFSGPGRQQAIFPTPDGDVIISYPAHLSADGRRALKAYLDLFLGNGFSNA